MTEFTGVVYPQLDHSVRMDVSVEFLRDFVILRMPENQWLGSWTTAELLKAHESGCRFKLTIKGAKVYFDVENPIRFLELLQTTDAPETETSIWSRLAGRMSSVKAGSGNDTDAPEDVSHSSVAEESQDTAVDEEWRIDRSLVAKQDLQTAVAEYQLDVVEWLEAGMASWFDFYFRLSPEGLVDSLEQSAEGLEKSALQLSSVAEQLLELRLETNEHEIVAGYAGVIRSWASALETIALGCRMDQHKRAIDGFTQMNEATASLEQLVGRLTRTPRLKAVTKALAHLEALMPQAQVSSKSITRAKDPWRRALLAAGWSRREPVLKRSLSSSVGRMKTESGAWPSWG